MAPMPSHIVKPNRDEDYYVEWSSIVDAPVWHGTRAEGIERGRERRWSEVEERFDRADAASTSAMWYRASWDDDESYILEQAGWFRRSKMREVVMAYVEHEDARHPAVMALLEPLDG